MPQHRWCSRRTASSCGYAELSITATISFHRIDCSDRNQRRRLRLRLSGSFPAKPVPQGTERQPAHPLAHYDIDIARPRSRDDATVRRHSDRIYRDLGASVDGKGDAEQSSALNGNS